MSTFSSDEHHQIKISDKWLSWGWEDTAQPKIIPFGNIKEVGKRMVRSNYNGGAMLVELNLPRYSYNLYSAPIAGQWQDYYKDQVLFVQSLPKEIRQKLTIRLDSTNYGWDQKKRWDDDFPDVKIDEGLKNIELLIKNSRLYIATYNATTCLEPLYLNIPTIIFWNCNHWELRDGAKSYFDLLESVGIFHKTPESAAQQMVKVWDDLEYWWQSNLVQEARIKFCEEYAKKPEDPLNRIKAILNV
jgi:putative transferase (TIGR04331 family)